MAPTNSSVKPIRVALLICGSPMPPIAAIYGDYLVQFRDLLGRGLERQKLQGKVAPDAELQVEGFDVREGIYPENIGQGWDALMLTGSAADAHADVVWINNLVQYVQQTRKNHPHVKMVGICFGHQIIGRAFDAKVARHTKGWELGWTSIQNTARGEQFWGTKDLRIQELHQDIVYDVPQGFTLLAGSEHTMNQSMISNDGKIVTLQGHPEFSGGIMRKFIELRTESGIFTPEFAQKTLKVLDNELDDTLMSARMVGFMGDH